MYIVPSCLGSLGLVWCGVVLSSVCSSTVWDCVPCFICVAWKLRLAFPGSGCWVEAALLFWNKFLRLVFHSVGFYSDAGGGRRRKKLSGSGRFASGGFSPDLGGFYVGVCYSAIQPGMVRLLVARCRWMAMGYAVAWWVALCFFLAACWRVLQGCGQGSMGRVPG